MGKQPKQPWNERLRLWLLLIIAIGAVATVTVTFGRQVTWAAVREKVKCEIKEANLPVVDALEKIHDALEYRNFIDNEMVPDSVLRNAERKYTHYKKATGK